MKNLPVFIGLFFLFLSCGTEETASLYICPPCDQECDALTFTEDGQCPHCKMNLIEYLDSTDLNQIKFHLGSGAFLIEGGLEKKEKVIRVSYYKPANFNKNSRILLVIPGAGRNGHDYRDAWIDYSDQQGVLILAVGYSEDQYDFADYHLASMVNHPATPSDASYDMNSNSAEWLYRDFDRIFKKVVQAVDSRQETYDVFGHSAGGQILHRMALFHDFTRAEKIISTNSGWYTLPNFEYNFPYGLKDTYVNEDDLKVAFGKKLVILVGEEDNADETRGHLRHTPEADAQGLHRLERGKFFYDQAQLKAEEIEAGFNWQFATIQNVGHDYKLMSKAAADFL